MIEAITVKNLTISYQNKTAIKGINLIIKSGSITGIMGPNGAGKSTLIKGILGLLRYDTGEVKIFGKDIDSWRKQIAYIPQKEQFDWDFPINVKDVVIMGRYSHLPVVGFPKEKDKKIADDALKKLEMDKYAKRQIRQLSGGQQQRIFFARALAQEPEIFILDEPFTGIDAKTELFIFQIMKNLKEYGKTILVVHHDLSKAKEYFDDIVLINQTLIAYGKTEEVFTEKNIEKTYRGRLTILQKTEELNQT